MSFSTPALRKTSESSLETKIIALPTSEKRALIPTTFVPLAPSELSYDEDYADLLFGLFHIMWRDMPRPKTYRLRLADYISLDGSYIGCSLLCHNFSNGHSRKKVIRC